MPSDQRAVGPRRDSPHGIGAREASSADNPQPVDAGAVSRRSDRSQLEPCGEYIDIGPFRFECDGHLPGVKQRAIEYHGGKVTHHATSPGDVGDVDVTFWTMVEWADVD